MTSPGPSLRLDAEQTGAVRRLAEVLLPGDEDAPAAAAVADLDVWIGRAVVALGREADALPAALATAPRTLDWETAKLWSEEQSDAFELVATVASAAYFMTPEALTAIGYPQGERKAPRNDQVVEEFETGVLDQVMAREPMYRKAGS